MNKKDLSERDIITQFIMPAIKKVGWEIEKQVREEVYFTDGRIYVKGNKTARGERKFADVILYHKPNIPIAIGDITLFSDAGKSYKCTERQINATEWGILKVSSTSGNNFLEKEDKFYVKDLDLFPTSKVQKGDFLLSRANTKELVANSVIVKQLSKNLLLSDKTIRYQFNNNILKHFCNYCNKLFYSREYYILNCTGASPSMKNINRSVLDHWLIPLPSLIELQAIIERVEKLLAMVDKLEKQVSQRKEQSEQLMQAVLREAFETQRTEVSPFLQMQLIATVIDTLENHNQHEGEMIIAKYLYILTFISRINTGFQFKQWHFGPYDPEIKKRISNKTYFSRHGKKGFETYSLLNKETLFKYPIPWWTRQ